MLTEETYEFNLIMAMLILSIYAIFIGYFCIKRIQELIHDKNSYLEEPAQFFDARSTEERMYYDSHDPIPRYSSDRYFRMIL